MRESNEGRMKEVKPDFKEGMTLEQAKTYEVAKRINKKAKAYKTARLIDTYKPFKWAVITTMVVSAALLIRWLILLLM